MSDDAALLLSAGLERRYSKIAEEHDAAIDTKLTYLEMMLQRPVPVEALGVQYSHLRLNQGYDEELQAAEEFISS
jgi:hypothetical protein